jgi:hypothetical protein
MLYPSRAGVGCAQARDDLLEQVKVVAHVGDKLRIFARRYPVEKKDHTVIVSLTSYNVPPGIRDCGGHTQMKKVPLLNLIILGIIRIVNDIRAEVANEGEVSQSSLLDHLAKRRLFGRFVLIHRAFWDLHAGFRIQMLEDQQL